MREQQTLFRSPDIHSSSPRRALSSPHVPRGPLDALYAVLPAVREGTLVQLSERICCSMYSYLSTQLKSMYIRPKIYQGEVFRLSLSNESMVNETSNVLGIRVNKALDSEERTSVGLSNQDMEAWDRYGVFAHHLQSFAYTIHRPTS